MKYTLWLCLFSLKQRTHQKGFTLTEMIIGLGLFSMVVFFTFTSYGLSNNFKSQMESASSCTSVQTTLLNDLQSEKIVSDSINTSASLSDSTLFTCIGNSDCSSTTLSSTASHALNLYNVLPTSPPAPVILLDSITSTAGFTKDGKACNSFDGSGPGNSNCPIQAKLSWQPTIYPQQVVINLSMKYNAPNYTGPANCADDFHMGLDITKYSTIGALGSPTFNSGTGFDDTVRAMALQPDGKYLVGGWFSKYNGLTPIKHLVRLNADGSYDSTFDSVFDASAPTNTGQGVYSIAIYPDGHLVMGGWGVYSFDGGFRILNSSGAQSPDGVAFLNSVNSGTYGFVNTAPANASSDGTGSLHDIGVYSIALVPDGISGVVTNTSRMLMAGNFSGFMPPPPAAPATVTANKLILLAADGSIDTTSAFNTNIGVGSASATAGFDGEVWALAFIPNPTTPAQWQVLVGGTFQHFNGTVANGLVKLNWDGTLDITYNPNLGTGFQFPIYPPCTTGNGPGCFAIASTPSGSAIIGGGWNNFAGSPRFGLAGVTATGISDPAFNVAAGGLYFGATEGNVYALARQIDGKILVGGWFDRFGTSASTPQGSLIRLNADGTVDTTFYTGTGINNTVRSIIILPGPKIVVGGWFTSFNGVPQCGITRLRKDGTLDVVTPYPVSCP